TNHVTDQESATSIQAMRQASKNIMFTVVNSRAYDAENMQTGPQNWQIFAVVIDIILLAGFAALEIKIMKKYKKDASEVIAEA
ncbi:MAG: hypothetical protein PHT89_11580, partial [Lachnospiraceae bacterium]|nr:hypothetical protein [Lachnospiraceae bacterium]